jgi:hypothetical protein
MSIKNDLIQYKFEDNILKVVKESYLNNNGKIITDFSFIFTREGTENITTHSRYKTIGGALRKFKKAIKAINEGTKIN